MEASGVQEEPPLSGRFQYGAGRDGHSTVDSSPSRRFARQRTPVGPRSHGTRKSASPNRRPLRTGDEEAMTAASNDGGRTPPASPCAKCGRQPRRKHGPYCLECNRAWHRERAKLKKTSRSRCADCGETLPHDGRNGCPERRTSSGVQARDRARYDADVVRTITAPAGRPT
jgi:hypothetical protein